MRLASLIIACAAALETSSTSENLLAAVGHRNVTRMEALIQNLAEESISEPGWKFDEDIKKALHAIRDMFVKSIQHALFDAHKHDQEDFNCFVEDCFGKGNSQYREEVEQCQDYNDQCTSLGEDHHNCRLNVYSQYKDMAMSCGKLHCFEVVDEPCSSEECLCPDLTYCHRKGVYDQTCEGRTGDCRGAFGSWMQSQINKYKEAYEAWQELYTACKVGYHAFLTVDMECDATQKEFEHCLCKKERCESAVCSDLEQRKERCWYQYDEHVREKECLEKDRKIDWSATKKIECYIDVLLHNYTKEELLTKCGSDTCVNVAREADYKHCATICPQVDHDGTWPNVECVDKQTGEIAVDYHDARQHLDQYHLGDGDYKCDANGGNVMTRHRGGGVDRQGEMRCTEHLDIDYQVPQVASCDPPSPPVCDAQFHSTWYSKYDDSSSIGCISDCCPDDRSSSCFPDEKLDSSVDGQSLTRITVKEHSHAWAYNRCECTRCRNSIPHFGLTPGRHCGRGAHTGIYDEAVVVQR